MDRVAFRIGRLVGSIEERIRAANYALGSIKQLREDIESGADTEFVDVAITNLEAAAGISAGMKSEKDR